MAWVVNYKTLLTLKSSSFASHILSTVLFCVKGFGVYEWPDGSKYFGEWNTVLFKKGPIEAKSARLAAIAASAAMRCEYCITAQVFLAKKAGATDDEIKAAIQIAAEVSRFSILLYGNEFGQDKLEKVLQKMGKQPAAK